MSKNTIDLREQIAEALGLEKGGITEHDSPANEHYYFFNEVMDYDTERIIMSQRINFEAKIEAVLALISNREKLARIEEVNRIAIDKELDLKWYLRFDGAECNPQESGEENVANAVMDYVEKRQKELATLRKELDGGQE